MGDEDALTEAVLALLAQGPVPMADLLRQLDGASMLDELRDDGVLEEDLGEAVIDEVLRTDGLWATPDRILARTDMLLDGLILTHRLTADELADGEVLLTPDLVILDWGHGSGIGLTTGGELRQMPAAVRRPGHDETTLWGPEGWLDGFSADDVIGFRRTDDGVAVELAASLADDADEVEALRVAAERRLRVGEGEEAVPLILDALTAAPATFRRPVRPLGELLQAAGLEQRGFSFGRQGTAWRSFGERAGERRLEQVIDRYRFDRCCSAALDAVRSAYDAFGEASAVDVTAGAKALSHGAVPSAFAEFVLHDGDMGDERLVRFATSLLDGARDRSRVGPQIVLGMEAERRGESSVAEQWFLGAQRDDPDHPGPALLLVDYAIDRGDLARASTLLRHPALESGGTTLAFLHDIRRELEAPWRAVGRNDPCPCGSGRKFKACCAREPKVALSARTRLLAFKVSQFALADHHRARFVGVASSACDPDDPDLIEQIRSLAKSGVIADFVIWDGGLAEDYLERRGDLLPVDERELLEEILRSPRALWEVVEVDRGQGMTLRDTASGDAVEVVEHTASQATEVGELLLSRLVRLPDQNQLWGTPLTVPLRLRESALALTDEHPDADMLASWYGAAIAFPRMMTRENEPLVLCHTELTTELAPDEITALLDTTYEHDGDGTWTETWELPSGEVISRGTIRFENERLLMDTMSEERMDRLVGSITELIPDAVVVVDERHSARDAMRDRRLAGGDDDDDLDFYDDDEFDDDDFDDELRPGSPDRMRPGVLAALEDYLVQQEKAWLDESIPALGGLTPRQAVDDPTRREDLLALLRELDRNQRSGGSGFDADRLRALLGLARPT